MCMQIEVIFIFFEEVEYNEHRTKTIRLLLITVYDAEEDEK